MGTLSRTPLYEFQRRLGAVFAQDDGWELPERYTRWEEEYHGARTGVALMDRSHWGRLTMTGKDRIDYLHRMSTNDLRALRPGTLTTTVLTTEKGRIIDHIAVLAREDALILVTSPQSRTTVFEWLNKFIFIDDIVLEDVTAHSGMLSLFGPRAAEFLGQGVGGRVDELPMNHFTEIELFGAKALLAKTQAVGSLGFDLMVESATLGTVWTGLLEEGRRIDLRPLGEAAYEVLRVEEGIPKLGHELGEEFNPLEAGLLRSISFDKGCYVGQEVIARLYHYEKLKRRLVGFTIEGDTRPALRSPVEFDGKEVGFLTSVVFSPTLKRVIALGYIRDEHGQPGQSVVVVDGETTLAGTVTALPFVARVAS